MGRGMISGWATTLMLVVVLFKLFFAFAVQLEKEYFTLMIFPSWKTSLMTTRKLNPNSTFPLYQWYWWMELMALAQDGVQKYPTMIQERSYQILGECCQEMILLTWWLHLHLTDFFLPFLISYYVAACLFQCLIITLTAKEPHLWTTV